jgi:hypothetical protein
MILSTLDLFFYILQIHASTFNENVDVFCEMFIKVYILPFHYYANLIWKNRMYEYIIQFLMHRKVCCGLEITNTIYVRYYAFCSLN